MKIFLIIIVILLCYHNQIVAQEKDSVRNVPIDQVGVVPGELQNMLSPGPVPAFYPGFDSQAEFPHPVLPSLNFDPDGRIADILPFANSDHHRLFRSVPQPFTLTGRSVWDVYQGNFGIRTYTVNKNLYLRTAGFANRNFNTSQRVPGYLNQTNFSSSLFVGYKFSEKFSISAGFTIQHYGNPLEISPQNRAFFP